MGSEYDDEFTFAGIGLGKMQQHPDDAQEFTDDDSGGNTSDDDNIDFLKRNKKDNDSQIYGVFGQSSDDENDGSGNGSNRNRTTRGRTSARGGTIKWKKQIQKTSLDSMFVKSAKVQEDKSLEDSMSERANGDDADADADADGNGSSDRNQGKKPDGGMPDAEHIQNLKEMKEANEKFHALLRRGVKRQRVRDKSEADKRVEARRSDNVSTTPTGLGFQSSGSDAVGGYGGGGLGFKSSASNETSRQPMQGDKTETIPSLSSFFGSQSKMANFVGSSQSQEFKKKPPIQRDPNTGKWEKHTKGIGMKLLSKMGYKGSGGLGAKRLKKSVSKVKDDLTGEIVQTETLEVKERTGISRPVEVVVRPGGLGLGFGKFKEATKLKTNQRIEAEVRGIDWEKKEAEELEKKRKEEEKQMQQEFGIKSSSLPTTSALLTAGNWRKGGAKRRKKQKAEVKVISYQEIIGDVDGTDNASKKELVIDMRGPTMTAIPSENNDSNDDKIQLGEELLHNVTFLLNTYENNLHSKSHFVRSGQSKANSLKSEVESLKQQKIKIRERTEKMTQILSLIEELEKYQKKGQRFNIEDEDEIKHIEGVLESMSKVFTTEEKKSLQFYSVLIPSLLGPLISQALDTWQPFTASRSETREYFCKIFGLCSKVLTSEHGESQELLLKNIFLTHFLPPIKRVLQSSTWNPTIDIEPALTLYESVLSSIELASAFLPTKDEKESNVETSVFGSSLHAKGEGHLTQLVKDAIMFDVIYPKLSRTISEYKAGSTTSDRLDLWILPWLLHLDYRSMLENILPDIKRKLRSIILLASRTTCGVDDELFFRHAGDIILKPWVNVINTNSFHSIVSECLAPQLGRYLSKTTFKTQFTKQDVTRIDIVLNYYASGMLSETLFLSLIEGEVLLPMSSALYNGIQSGELNASGAAALYRDWKIYLFRSSYDCIEGMKPSRIVLAEDPMICQIFYGCLLAINATSIGDNDKFEDLEPPSSDTINYRVVQARRAKEARLREEEEALRGKVDSMNHASRTHVASRGRNGATFREVVEDFANLNSIPFHPKTGPNSIREGKKIFMFGNAQVYLDSSVVFVLRNGHWKAISLKDLVELSG